MTDQHTISSNAATPTHGIQERQLRSVDRISTEESVVRTHYDDDIDDDDDGRHHSRENAPLMGSTVQEGRRRAGSGSRHITQEGSDHSLHSLKHQQQRQHRHRNHHHHHHHHHRHPEEDDEPPLTPLSWLEWTIKNGIHPSTWTKHTYIKAALLLTLLTLIILAFTVLRVQDHVKEILSYIDDHRSIGAVLFVTFYTIACWLFLPGSLFTIGAGFLFRPMPFALAIVLMGDVLGALGSFLLGRYIFYDWVKSTMSKHPKFGALDQVIQDDGWKIVVMLRLTPIPFNLITYFFSITSISLYTLLWATAAGVFPGSCLGIWIGSLLKGLSGIDNPELETKNLVILAMNGVFIVCSILTLSIFGKRSMRNAMAKLDEHQDDEQQHHHPHLSEPVENAERGDEDLWNADLEAASAPVRRQGLDQEVVAQDEEESIASSTTTTGLESPSHVRKTVATDSSSGFTRGEKMTFVGIAVVAVLNLSVCIPLYYHFAGQDD
ncbi:hypothetical protein BGX28_009769 [Mortierella sp. GBA30]|nr:hypothetical protein BGX28_009769 [Mortierella sp. GBA30]